MFPNNSAVLPQKFTVGLDPDGVILDGLKQKTKIAEALYGVKIAPEECKRETLLSKNILTNEQYEEVKMIGYRNREWALRFEFIPGAKAALARFQRLGMRLPVVTRRPEEAADYIQELFNLKGLHALKVHSSQYSQDKWPVIESIGGVHVFVDDDLEILEYLVGKVPHLIMFTQPYNTHQKPGSSIVRANCWSEVEDHVLSLARQYGHPLKGGHAASSEAPALVEPSLSTRAP